MYYHYVFSGLHAANATADFASAVYTNVAQFSGSMGTPDTWCVHACVYVCVWLRVYVCMAVCENLWHACQLVWSTHTRPPGS